MFSYEFYKVLHLIGFFLLLTGLLGVFFTVWSKQPFQGKIKTFSFALHGTGLLFVLVSGFGLMARLGYIQFIPAWVYVKIAIWMGFAIVISLLKRKGHLGLPLYILLLIGYLAASYMAVYKPAL